MKKLSLIFILFAVWFIQCKAKTSLNSGCLTEETSSVSDTKSSWDYIPDTKIPVVSAKSTDAQAGQGIEKSYDGDFTTLYHSSWRVTDFPVTLIYDFAGKERLDYIVYYPRTEGLNGNFIEFELWGQSQSQSDYTKINDYNFEGSARASVIYLPRHIENVKSIKFIIKSGMGDPGTNGFASCAEMEFYKKDGKVSIPDVFTDITCSRLKSNISQKDIDAIKNTNYRNLAKALYNKNYDSQYRIRDYKPYPEPATKSKENRTGTYSLMDNPTGMYVDEKENIVVFVGNTYGQRVALRSLNLDKDYACTDYLLKEGMNVMTAKDKGQLYIMYHTSDPKAKPIKIHIASGKVNGYYDVTKNTNKDWMLMLNSTVCNYIDVVGKYAHLTFGVDDFKAYTPDVESLIQIYDSIVWMEQRFLGLEKYKRMNKNRMYFYLANSGYYMFATANRTGYSKGSMSQICNPAILRSTAIWGPAHEVGHINQTQGFKWVGLTEVSNNVYAMYIQQQFGNPSRLGEEKLNSKFDGIWFNRYEKGFTEMIAGKVSHMDHADVFCKLIPFWQLQLYNSNVKGNNDFYGDVHEMIRRNPVPKTDADAQLQFMKLCCDAAKTDFTDFFTKWGMLSAIDGTVIDHSSIRNKVNSKRTFVITQQQVDDVKRYAAKYKKPEENVHYIHDTQPEILKAFRENQSIKIGRIERSSKKVELSGWENVVVFEIYDGDNLVFVTPSYSFELPEQIKNPVLHAVPAKGKPIVKNL